MSVSQILVKMRQVSLKNREAG